MAIVALVRPVAYVKHSSKGRSMTHDIRRSRRASQISLRNSALLTIALSLVMCASTSAASLPAGTFVFDETVNAVARSGSNVYVSGSFTEQQMPTGGGLVLSAAGSGAPNPSMFPKVAGNVGAVAADGSGGWFIAGRFTHVGGLERRGLAHVRSDGTVDPNWDPAPDDEVLTIAVSGTTVYVGGEFSSVGNRSRSYLAALDATTGAATAWNPGPNQLVSALAASDSTVYAGGRFTSIGGEPRHTLAALDAATGATTAWNPDPDTSLHSIDLVWGSFTLSGSMLYTLGGFSSIAGQTRDGLAAFDTTTGDLTAWNPARNGAVNSLAVSGSTVYLGGRFSNIGGQHRNGLAALDVTTGDVNAWDPAPTGDYVSVDTLAATGSTVFAGGWFTTIGGQPRRRLAALDGTTGEATDWNPRPNESVRALAVSGSTVYVGGLFAGAGPSLATVSKLAKLNAAGDLDTSWTPSVDGYVDELAATGSALYAAGAFTSIGGEPRNGLAALDPATGNATGWNPSPDDGSGGVFTLATSGSVVYAGGSFSSIGGQSRRNLASLSAATGAATEWDPSPNGAVHAIALSGSTVYVGGDFSGEFSPTIGGQLRNYLAAVDASTGAATSWNPRATDRVHALAASESTVYVGGRFQFMGPSLLPRRKIAAVDIATGAVTGWNPDPGSTITFADGVDVNALAVAGSTVYVGGFFESIGGRPRNGFAALDATTGAAADAWNPDPSSVSAVALSGSTVYVGGSFSAIDGAITGPFAVLLGDGQQPDATPPTIAITTPAEGQHFRQGQAVASAFSCDDGDGSGVQSCSGPAAIDTAAVGAHQFTVTASDQAGKTTSKTISYVVDSPPDGDPGPGNSGPSPSPSPGPGNPGPGNPGPSPSPVDKSAPTAKLSGTTSQKLAKTISVTITCTSEACSARASGSVRVPKVGHAKARSYAVKAVTRKVAKGKKITIKLTLTAATRTAITRALRARKRVSVAVKVVVTDAAGNKRALTRQIKLKR